MAFRATRPTAYTSVRSRAAQTKKQAQDASTAMAAGSVSANLIRQLLDTFIIAKAEFAAAAAIPGMADYAQAQEGDAGYDVAAEFTAMQGACDAVLSWIVANVPTNGGYVQMEQWSVSGVTARSFTTAQTAGLRTVLDAFAATVG